MVSFYTGGSERNFGSMDTITLFDALTIMNQVDGKGNPKPFSIEATACDLNRNRGGYTIKYEHAIQCNAKGGKVQTFFTDFNNVRNIRGVKSREIRSIHPILITKLNGKTITL